MRGKAPVHSTGGFRIRITPAYAGKSYRYSFRKICNKDHPRLCGEKETDIQARNKKAGSPPPMRGKATCLSHQERPAGITPAYAGKSRRLR